MERLRHHSIGLLLILLTLWGVAFACRSAPSEILPPAAGAEETAQPAPTPSPRIPPSSNPASALTEEELVVRVVEQSVPAVVSIILTQDLPVYERSFLNPFYDPFLCQLFGGFFCEQPQPPRQKGTERRQVGAGTGFIVTPEGIILTNKHVVDRDDVDYTVILNDGTRYPAQVVVRHPFTDLALVRIRPKGPLPTLKLGDSDQVKLGQTVVAIGNALGRFSNTVSKGIVSGISRSIVAQGGLGQTEELSGLIQTDAAINPGNSGGPLLNLHGEVVGINTAVAGGAENIGFALPINLAKKLLEDYLKKGKISYPFLGIRYVLVTPQLAKAYNLSVDYGALILGGRLPQEPAVIPGSPAHRAGLREGDIILEADGQKVTPENPLAKMIRQREPGEALTLKVLRQGQELRIRVILGEGL